MRLFQVLPIVIFLAALNVYATSVNADRLYSMAVAPWTGEEVYVVAGAKGFYEKEGINVDVKIFSDIHPILQMP